MTSPHRTFLLPAIILSLVFFSPCYTAAAPLDTRPEEGLRDRTPRVHAFIDARIVVEPGKVIENGTLVIRDGVIVAAGKEVVPPADARTWVCSGKTIYPGLIDAYSEAKVDGDAGQSSAGYWNSLVTPQLSVAEHYQADEDQNKKLRSQGIVARLLAPAGGIIKGTSALVATGDRETNHAIIKPDAAQHVRLTISARPRRDKYPNSPMGAVALARQAMYDAAWYARAWQAHRENNRLERPEQNDALAALDADVEGGRLFVLDATDALFALRADDFAREFDLDILLRGSGNEYRRLDAIRKTGRGVIVPVNFPKAPDVRSPEGSLNASLEELMHWDIAPENPKRLAEAGVKIALTTQGLKEPAKFIAAVREAVERGLSSDAALGAMTTAPAEMFDVAGRLGSLERGRDASFVITDGDLFEEATLILETWVAGQRYEVTPLAKVDLRGTWRATVTQEAEEGKKKTESFDIHLKGKPKKLEGMVEPPGEKGKKAEEGEKAEGEQTKLENIEFSNGTLTGTFDAGQLGREGFAQFSAVVIGGNTKKPAWTGTIVWPNGSRGSFTARRIAEYSADAEEDDAAETKSADGDAASGEPEDADEKKKSDVDRTASFAVNYPLGAYGLDQSPQQPRAVVFTGATVWTCGKPGIIENASVLVERGKIAAVGKKITVPEGALVIDCAGRHITPGIIDCHSHMATDGGINESAQAITAEVRIGDFIDADDITIYRQLAGGVTAANILHGSANPIGGQNQVVKLRWGALPEEMKFAAAPAGIKFALGENVKQSNWGDKYTTRYPQSRMGVEQIIRDAFAAAREYGKQRQAWRETKQGLPPRRDLELDALAEVLAGERWIHCHSYRQDEILALIRTLDDYGVTIGTFQHILEGYKVADAMARHGAMGSAFSDWWAYKFEVYDAIPYNGALMHEAGIVVSFNSDDHELGRHLNQEAAKAVKYGGVDPAEALKFVTLNPARQLRIDEHTGSLAKGKDADLVVWSGPPLSTLSRCEQTWIDGRKYFDREEDLQRRETTHQMRTTLVQKILASGVPMRGAGEVKPEESALWPRHDTFCHGHEHGHGHD